MTGMGWEVGAKTGYESVAFGPDEGSKVVERMDKGHCKGVIVNMPAIIRFFTGNHKLGDTLFNHGPYLGIS